MATVDVSEEGISQRFCLNTTVSAKRSTVTTYPFKFIMIPSHTSFSSCLLCESYTCFVIILHATEIK